MSLWWTLLLVAYLAFTSGLVSRTLCHHRKVPWLIWLAAIGPVMLAIWVGELLADHIEDE